MNNKRREYWLPVLILGSILLVCSICRLFDKYEHIFYDLSLQLRPAQTAHQDIVIIEIDDSTLKRLGQWPLPRDFHASVIDILNEVNVRAMVFDLLFIEPTIYDDLFAESIEQANNVYLAQVYDIPQGISVEQLNDQSTPVLAPITKTIKDKVFGFGHINVIVDPDGKIRKTIAVLKDQTQHVLQLGVQIACDYMHLDCTQIQSKPNELIIDDQLRIPVTNHNEILVNYPTTWAKSFKHYSYYDIIRSYKKWKETNSDKEILAELNNKICFIGLTATGTVDLRAIPLENNYPMVGLHASVLSSILQQSFIQQASPIVNSFLHFIMFLISVLFCLRFAPLRSFIGNCLLVVQYVFCSLVLLNIFGVWIDVFFPVIIVLSVYVCMISLRWMKEMHKRQMLEKEMLIAQGIQNQFLKGPDQVIDEEHIAVWFQPAKYVAGDLYELFKIDEHKTGIFIGDVSGKGVAAAMLMAQGISLFRIFSRQIAHPHEVLERLNQGLCGRSAGRFITALYCIVDKQNNKIEICSAGHGSVLLTDEDDKQVNELELPGSPPLGVMEQTVYQTKIFPIKSAQKLICFSDGITETRNKQAKEFEIEGLIISITQKAGNSPAKLLEYIKTDIQEYSAAQTEQHDDITLIIFTF